MKKSVLFLSVVALVFTSCGNDDDDVAVAADSLIGTWKYHKYIENDVEQILEPCENEETLIFNADGAYITTDYVEVNSACEVDGTYTGTWSNGGNNNYTFIDDGDSFTEQVFFEGNTFYFIDTYFDGTENVTYKDVYIRQ